MATISPTPKLQFLDANGNPLSYGLLYTYVAGTTTPKGTFTTAAQTTANTNPILLDSRGQADVWLRAGEGYKFTLLDSSSVLQYTVDNITAAGTMSTQNADAVVITGGTISGVTITGPITGNVTGNVTGNLTGDVTGNVFGGFVNASSYNGGQLAGMRNKFINGAFFVNQRRALGATAATTSGTSTAANSLLCPDRWSYVSNTTAILNISQENDGPASFLTLPYSGKFIVTNPDAAAGATEYFSIVQTIEGYETRIFANRTFTISFWVKASVAGTYSLALWNAIGSGGDIRSYVTEYSISLPNTWEYKTITVLYGIPFNDGTWYYDNQLGLTVGWALYAGASRSTSAINSWLVGNYFASTNQVNAVGTIGNSFFLTGVQIELGDTATPFELRPFATELQMCQRYYEKSFNYGVTAVQNVGSTNGAAYGISMAANQPFAANVSFAVTKRVSPTVVTYAPDAASADWSTNTTTPTASVVNTGTRGIVLRGATSTTAFNAYSIHWDANAEL